MISPFEVEEAADRDVKKIAAAAGEVEEGDVDF
jgi:hypothetical protein